MVELVDLDYVGIDEVEVDEGLTDPFVVDEYVMKRDAIDDEIETFEADETQLIVDDDEVELDVIGVFDEAEVIEL